MQHLSALVVLRHPPDPTGGLGVRALQGVRTERKVPEVSLVHEEGRSDEAYSAPV